MSRAKTYVCTSQSAQTINAAVTDVNGGAVNWNIAVVNSCSVDVGVTLATANVNGREAGANGAAADLCVKGCYCSFVIGGLNSRMSASRR